MARRRNPAWLPEKELRFTSGRALSATFFRRYEPFSAGFRPVSVPVLADNTCYLLCSVMLCYGSAAGVGHAGEVPSAGGWSVDGWSAGGQVGGRYGQVVAGVGRSGGRAAVGQRPPPIPRRRGSIRRAGRIVPPIPSLA